MSESKAKAKYVPLPQRKLHRLPASCYATTQYEYFFTICARHHGSPFQDRQLATTVIESLIWTKKRYHWQLFCYCLMPDHLHFVCRLNEHEFKLVNAGARGELPESVLDHIARFKSYTTHESWKFGVQGQLWQKSHYDRVMDLQRPFEAVVQYSLENPVRKGLVNQWQDWPYSEIVDSW